MLINGPPCQRPIHLSLICLLSCALPQRIESQCYKAFQNQINGNPLRLWLPLLGVARLQKDCGKTARSVGAIKIRSHKEARRTLENHFFDHIVLTLDTSRNSDIQGADRKSTRLNSSHSQISYAVFCLKKKKTNR